MPEDSNSKHSGTKNRGRPSAGHRAMPPGEPRPVEAGEYGAGREEDGYNYDAQYDYYAPYDYDDYLEEGYQEDPDKDAPQDMDLEYLNSLEETGEEYHHHGAGTGGKSASLRLVALVTVLAFLGLALAASWPVLQFPLAELVGRSLQLQKDIDVQRLQRAVVQIDVVARRSATALAAEGKSGTGFNIRPEGLVVTNHHVIEGALNMTITFPDGKIYRAESWSSRPELDLAIIKLQADSLPVVPVNTQGAPATGDKIRVVGNPLGLNNVVVDGKVDRYLRVGDNPEPVFSIDAPVYPGNSGSPVFNSEGDVVGVVFARYYREVDGEEKLFGLAVPIIQVINMQHPGERA